MKIMYIDWGNMYSKFYIEDTENCTVKMSNRYPTQDIAVTITDLVKNLYPAIKLIKIDSFGVGSGMADDIEHRLKCRGMYDIKFIRYKFQALEV